MSHWHFVVAAALIVTSSAAPLVPAADAQGAHPSVMVLAPSPAPGVVTVAAQASRRRIRALNIADGSAESTPLTVTVDTSPGVAPTEPETASGVVSDSPAATDASAPLPPPTSGLYVTPTGSDANACTPTAPCASISQAGTLANAGDTVHVAPGTYQGAVTTNVSGTASARIRYVSDIRGRAKIQLSSQDFAWTNFGDYVDIEGFDVSGASSIGILNYASHVLVINNHVHDIGGCTSNGGAGIDHAGSPFTTPRSATDNNTVGNVVHDIHNTCPTGSGLSFHGIYHAFGNGVIADNIVYATSSYGIHLWHSPNGVRILNNLAFNNGAAGLIVGGAEDLPISDNHLAANNILVDNAYYGARVFGNVGNNITFLDNLVFGNTPSAFDFQNPVIVSGTVTADPKFVNYQPDGTGDYHLQSTSPAIKAGVTVPEASSDLAGITRAVGAASDIGPYESH